MSLNTSLDQGEMPTYVQPLPQRHGYPQVASSAGMYHKNYPTASSYAGSGKPVAGYTGTTSSYPLASSGSSYPGSAYNQQQQYTGSKSIVGSTSTAPQQYSGSTSQYPASTSAAPGVVRESLPSTASYAASTAPAPNNSNKSYATQPSTYSRATARSQASLSPTARLAQRGPPPRFRPWMIILVTMALGLLFIGIVLTIVAHWPGYTAIGSDPLEIVGPTLLAVGGAGLITCIVLSIVHSRQEKEVFMKRIAASQKSIYASRMTMQSNHTLPPMGEEYPQASNGQIMKHPSTSTYGAPMNVEGASDSGIPSSHTYNNSTNMSYEPDSDASEASAGKFEVYRIDTIPDPSGAAPRTSTSAMAQDNVPQPVRSRTRDYKKKATADPKYQPQVSADPGYQPNTSAGRTSPMIGAGALGVAGVGSPMDLGGVRSSRQMHDYSAEGYDMYDTQEPPKEKSKKSKSKSRPKRQAEAMQASGNNDEDNGGFDTPAKRLQEPLRIAIRAQPGAQVSITPGFSSYSQQELKHDSTETEI